MPPTLDLGRAAHSKMIISPPRINLRRAASYNHDKGPLSATSSRFNFNHLLFSPPPSPSLPALIPRPKKSPIHPRPSRVFRLIFWLSGTVLFFYFAISAVRRHASHDLMPWSHSSSSEFDMAGQGDLPSFPTPIIGTDKNGLPKWTVSIPPDYHFPLSIKEYSDMSSKCRIVAVRVRNLRNHGHSSQQHVVNYEMDDPYFVDVQEAETAGLLRGVASTWWHSRGHDEDGDLVGESKDSLVEKPVCESTMTFVLETADAGLGNTLMMLWSFYGLAKKQGRAFFIDDTRWAYGKYSDIFGMPPEPACRPPPRHEMLPCPPQARHIVVSAATAKGLFGHVLGGKESDSSSTTSIDEPQTLFALAREGYRALFRLNKEDQEYVDDRVKVLSKKAQIGDSRKNDGLVVGMHVRRGDLHPMEYQYRHSYIPTNIFIEKARSIIDSSYNGTGRDGSDNTVARQQSVLVVASDDPTVYESEEFHGTFQAQEQIRLASKTAIQRANPDRRVMHHFVDDTFGWEGGFFAAMFWNLGLSTMSTGNAVAAALTEKTRLPPSAETLRLRSYIGRAYMMDLAVLDGASDVVICTVSAMGCRLLAVMMGWETAFESGNWVNIDGDYGWTGISW
jgi:hypothetical protein